MQIIHWDKQTPKRLARAGGYEVDKDLFKKVNRILQEVKAKGDQALLRFTRSFDGINLPLKRLEVNEGDINRAYELGWIKKKSVRNGLIQKISELSISAFIKQLEREYAKGSINERAYNLLKEDASWLLNK